MNKYPVWWDTTITIFNRYENPQTNLVSWHRTVLDHCFWKNNFQLYKMGEVEIQSDNIICRIPENNRFLEKHQWVQLPDGQMDNYFTIDQGDIIVKGEVLLNINEYGTDMHSNDLIQAYKWQGCMVVDRLTIDTGIGRGLPHYRVEGV